MTGTVNTKLVCRQGPTKEETLSLISYCGSRKSMGRRERSIKKRKRRQGEESRYTTGDSPKPFLHFCSEKNPRSPRDFEEEKEKESERNQTKFKRICHTESTYQRLTTGLYLNFWY